MSNQPLNPQTILQTAEAVLKRYGPGKATVVDVAAALGVSHGSIYRFFPSKQALRDAVVQRWLARVSDALAPLSQENGPPLEDLLAWFQALRHVKLSQLREEPELFEAFRVMAGESRDVLAAYKAQLEDQVAAILRRGIEAGVLAPTAPEQTAHALMEATSLYHHPSQAFHWNRPDSDESFNQLWQLLIHGLATRSEPHRK